MLMLPGSFSCRMSYCSQPGPSLQCFACFVRVLFFDGVLVHEQVSCITSLHVQLQRYAFRTHTVDEIFGLTDPVLENGVCFTVGWGDAVHVAWLTLHLDGIFVTPPRAPLGCGYRWGSIYV